MTKFEQTLSSVLSINASIIQGPVIGPTVYVINASDLKALDPSNYLDKYADDTYLIVPFSNSCTIPAELDNVSAWVAANKCQHYSRTCDWPNCLCHQRLRLESTRSIQLFGQIC